jgi:hypothetical protein
MRAHGIRNTESNEEKDVKHMSKILALAAGLAVSSLAFGQVTSPGAVTPAYSPGNFSGFADDLQACYDLYPNGVELVGYKVDSNSSSSDDFVSFIVSPDGKTLSWVIVDGKMLAVVVKGGNGYNFYDYVSYNGSYDGGLQSPPDTKKGKVVTPQISHYNVCYEPDPERDLDWQGCTPGYWRNHANRWVEVSPGDDFDTTFEVDLFPTDITLGAAIWAKGSGNNALARHATAALLNAYAAEEPGSYNPVLNVYQQVNYPFTVAAVKQMVQGAVNEEGDIEATKDALAAANELGCPLSGSRADPVLY